MQYLFLKVLNLSIWAGWIVLGILILRFLLKKMPKWLHCLLWLLVAIRLLIPDIVESPVSVIPSKETVPKTIVTDSEPEIHSGLTAFNYYVNPILQDNLAPEQGDDTDKTGQGNGNSENVLQNELLDNSVDSKKDISNFLSLVKLKEETPIGKIVSIASVVWIFGMILMSVYSMVCYFKLCYRVRMAVRLRENIWQSEQVDSSFILGLIKPRIYLPYHVDETSMQYIVAHEQAHIKRRDYLIKPFAFLLLTIYWFHPLLWVAYIYLCRDIELACDEKVIRSYGTEERKEYSKVLVASSVNRRLIIACPVAFGEIGVKERVKNVMYYKKPAFWAIIIAVVTCVIAGICLLTAPEEEKTEQSEVEVVAEAVRPESLYSEAEMYDMVEDIWDMDNLGMFSAPGAYIQRHRDIYDKLVSNGEATLYFLTNYMWYTGERDAIMSRICFDINGIDYYGKEDRETTEIPIEHTVAGLKNFSEEGQLALFNAEIKRDTIFKKTRCLGYLPVKRIISYEEFIQFSQELSEYCDLNAPADEIECYQDMMKQYDENYFKDHVLYLIYAPTIGDKGTPYIDSVTKSGDEKCLVFRVAHEYVEIKAEDKFAYKYLGVEEEEKKWLLAVGVDKKTAASCSLMFALETVGGSK